MLALPTGRNTVRWTLAVLLGVVGTASLVVEPLTWLATGASPVAYLADGRGASLVRRAGGQHRRDGTATGTDEPPSGATRDPSRWREPRQDTRR